MLLKVGDFLVEMGKGSFEGFFVIGVGGVFEVVGDANTGELQVFASLFVVDLFG